jgi:hypothetical protein
MKKFVVLLVVVAISCFSAAAFAADISVSGSIDVRSRDFSNLNAVPTDNSALKDNATADGTQRDTQERVRLNIDAKAGDVKGRISIENDWDSFGRLETPMANGQSTDVTTTGGKETVFLKLREAWINFNVPGIPVNVNVGHQLLQLGNAWFFRDMKYGSDAWVVANVTGANTAAFVDIKVSEGETSQADDLDAYALLDVFKLSDTMMVGADLTQVHDRRAALDEPPFVLGRAVPGVFQKINLDNLGVNFNGQVGPVNLKAEVDKQFGKAEAVAGGIDSKFKGSQVVVQGNVAMEPVAINFTLARGTGNSPTDTDTKQYVTILDADQHYSFLYEYKVKTAAINIPSSDASTDELHTGFANTTALNVGATFAVAKSLSIGADLWYLRATEAVALNGATDSLGNSATSRKLGTELDLKVNWQMYDNLSWNWEFGYFKPGDAYDTPALGQPAGVNVSSEKVLGAQGVLSFKF